MHGYGPDTPELGSGAKMIDGFSARSVHERVGFCSFTSLTCHEKGRGYSLLTIPSESFAEERPGFRCLIVFTIPSESFNFAEERQGFRCFILLNIK